MSNYSQTNRLRAKLTGVDRVLDIVTRSRWERAMAGCRSVSQVVAGAATGRALFKSHTLFCCAFVVVGSPGGSV